MMNNPFIKISLVLLLSFICAAFARRQVYIVELEPHQGQQTRQANEDRHHSYLQAVKSSPEEAKSSKLYSYFTVLNGFCAVLTPEEADALSEMNGVISVIKDEPLQLQTSRSWEFMSLLEAGGNSEQAGGLDELVRKANGGSDIIVGVFDTGIWPEAISFTDTWMDPIPSSWKGICQTGDRFTTSNCNRKLIGARFFAEDYEATYGDVNPAVEFRSPRDMDGHGTSISSTLGGWPINHAQDNNGFGNGTAKGGAPRVRIATYKVCWRIPGGGATCPQGDMIAAFESAIADGVHVISASIASSRSQPFQNDMMARGALIAVRSDIVVLFGAGNSGPTAGSVGNVAPWLMSVGASSIDRVFSSVAVLGNGIQIQGQSITPIQQQTYNLVYAGDIEIPGSTNSGTTGRCGVGTLMPNSARGRAVFCLGALQTESGHHQVSEIRRVGGVASVLVNNVLGNAIILSPYAIPTTVVFASESNRIFTYIRTSGAPTVTLMPVRTLEGTQQAGAAPFMAGFSSRGPATVEPNIIKPDITAPGLNILVAHTGAGAGTNVNTRFRITSGTSISCPHVSAVAALLKAVHPTWSNAAIRSAIMTTATVTNNQGNPITNELQNVATPLDYGSGHMQPSKAADPGLVYETEYTEYIMFLCASIGRTLDPNYPCPTIIRPQSNLNYPSLAIANVGSQNIVVRRVKNVGGGSPTYTVRISQPAGYVVQISPATLSFSPSVDTRSFTIIVQRLNSAVRNRYAFGSYTWSDGQGHVVRSPIALSTTGSNVITTPDAELHAST